MGIEDNTKRIENDVKKCLEINGFEVNEDSVYLMPDNATFEMTCYATGEKDNKRYSFKMLLASGLLKSNSNDEIIEIDITPFKS